MSSWEGIGPAGAQIPGDGDMLEPFGATQGSRARASRGTRSPASTSPPLVVRGFLSAARSHRRETRPGSPT